MTVCSSKWNITSVPKYYSFAAKRYKVRNVFYTKNCINSFLFCLGLLKKIFHSEISIDIQTTCDCYTPSLKNLESHIHKGKTRGNWSHHDVILLQVFIACCLRRFIFRTTESVIPITLKQLKRIKAIPTIIQRQETIMAYVEQRGHQEQGISLLEAI